jgi:NitT/TauT family transport system ATP-binding protein
MICDRVGLSFHTRDRKIEALRNLSFQSRPGEFLSIVGPSGAGKTTLLRILAGHLKPDTGIVSCPPTAKNILVRQEGGVFPWLTVLENATFGLEIQGVGRKERQNRALPLLARFGLAGRESDYPNQLSVGMKQRVALIQALLTDPEVLLLDEPFAGLDCQTRWEVQGELVEVWEQQQQRTVILVTHDVDEALPLSNRVLVLSRQPGRIVAEIEVSLPRPRDLSMLLTVEALRLKRRILGHLGFPIEDLKSAVHAQ